MMAAVQERRIPVAEGVSLHAVVWQSGSAAPPFLLVHGLSSNCRTWEGVAGLLHDAGHTVATLDLRGHGRSDKPSEGYDFGTLTSDLGTAMAALSLEEPVVVGQSTGGNLAVELAHRASSRLAGVVGIDGGALELQDRWPEWDDCRRTLAPPDFAGTPVADFEATIRRHHPDWPDWGVAATVANCEVRDDGTVRPWLDRDHHLEILRALWEHRPSQVIGQLRVPLLLVLAGTGDDKPAGVRRAEEAGDHVRVEWIDGDHDLHIQHAGKVAELILEAHG
jgi:pimeloyl-ACP methyl ester carboxylesterase